MQQNKKKAVFFSFQHPDLSPGGGQAIAYRQHKYWNKLGGDSIFIASSHEKKIKTSGGSPITQIDTLEFLYESKSYDFFYHINHDTSGEKELLSLIESYSPDILYVNHFIGFGVDFFMALRNKINTEMCLIVHEFISICANNGHLRSNSSHRICYEIKHGACARCLSGINIDEFGLRENLFRSFFKCFNEVIAVSDFTMRTINSVFPEVKIRVVSNGPFKSEIKEIKDRPAIAKNRVTISYIGQIHKTKGVEELIAAVEDINNSKEASIELKIWGSFTENKYKDYIEKKIEKISTQRRRPEIMGEYHPDAIPEILKQSDIVVVPSLWPESYCLTADEAIYSGAVLVCSDFPAIIERYEIDEERIFSLA